MIPTLFLHQINPGDFHVFERVIVLIGFGAFDRVHCFHTACHFAKVRIRPAIRWRGQDEKLRAIGIWTGIRHRQSATTQGLVV